MRTVAIVLTVLMLTVPLSGCFGDEEQVFIEKESDFPDEIPLTTWYHYSGGIDAMDAVAVSNANITVNLSGDNAKGATIVALGTGDGASIFAAVEGLEWTYQHSRPGLNEYNIRVVSNSWGTNGDYNPVSYTHLRAHET